MLLALGLELGADKLARALARVVAVGVLAGHDAGAVRGAVARLALAAVRRAAARARDVAARAVRLVAAKEALGLGPDGRRAVARLGGQRRRLTRVPDAVVALLARSVLPVPVLRRHSADEPVLGGVVAEPLEKARVCGDRDVDRDAVLVVRVACAGRRGPARAAAAVLVAERLLLVVGAEARVEVHRVARGARGVREGLVLAREVRRDALAANIDALAHAER
jgi:hypothetical protein